MRDHAGATMAAAPKRPEPVPVSERSGVRSIPSAYPTIEEVDAAWGELLASSSPLSLSDLAASLFEATGEREALAAEMWALMQRLRAAKAREEALRRELHRRMDEGDERRVRCSLGAVIFVADRMQEKNGELVVLSGSTLRLVPAVEECDGA